VRSAATGLGGLALLSLVAGGCGARSYIAAPGAKYPVSLSGAVRGPDGKVLAEGETQKLGSFKMDYTACSMLWTLIPFTGTKDISKQVNRQIANKGGEAVTNLTVESSAGAWTLMTMLGVLPDCGHVKVRGDIIARRPPPPAAVPPAAPPAAPAESATPRPVDSPPPAPGAANPMNDASKTASN
jgi:hypothetical protein